MSDEELKDDQEQLDEQVEDHDADHAGDADVEETTDDTEQSDVTPDEPEQPTSKGQEISPDLAERWERAVATMEQAANRARNNPTEQNLKAAEKAKSRIEKLVETEDLDIDPARALKDIGTEVMDYQRRSDETDRQYEARMRQQDQQIAALNEQLYRMKFSSDHPDLSGRYDELVQQTAKDEDVQEAMDLARDSDDPKIHAMAQRVWNKAWKQVVKQASDKGKATAKDKPRPKKNPAGANPLASRSGQASGKVEQLSPAEILYGTKK